MIEPMAPNPTAKQTDIVMDQALHEFAGPHLNSFSENENAVRICSFGRIAVPADPICEQISNRSGDPTESTVRTAPVDRASATDAKSNAVADWVHEIRKVWSRGLASTLELARVVSEARNG